MQLTDLARNAGVDAAVALVDGGGTVEFQNVSSQAAATVPLNATAFAAAATGTANMNTSPVPEDSDAQGPGVGTQITKAVWKNSGGTTIWQNSVSGSGGGGEIQFSDANDVITAGSVVQLTSFSYTQPAGSI